MFTFTKEQKQAKLAKANVNNYNILYEKLQTTTDSLQREAISNSIKDILDIFTILRDSYNLDKTLKSTSDYRCLRLQGMPGVVFSNYQWIANDYRWYILDLYKEDTYVSPKLAPWLHKALSASKLKAINATYATKALKYRLNLPFTSYNYNELGILEYALANIYKSSPATFICVASNFNQDVCKQFAKHNNIDIYISNN